MGKPQVLTQAVEIRNLAFDAIKEIRSLPTESTDDKLAQAQAITGLVRSWETAVDRIRILRGRPLPGSFRPGPNGTRRRPRAVSYVDMIPAPPALPGPEPGQQPIDQPADHKIEPGATESCGLPSVNPPTEQSAT